MEMVSSMRFSAAPLALSGLVLGPGWNAASGMARSTAAAAIRPGDRQRSRDGSGIGPRRCPACRHPGRQDRGDLRTPLAGTRVIDASRHVVAPGFIDLHEHGQQEESYRMMVRDGVTSAFELEVGTGDVAAVVSAREGGQIVNYGVSIGQIPARMKVLGDPGTGLLPAGIGGSGLATTRRWRPWKPSSAKGSRKAPWPWASAARTRPARPCRRSSGCSASQRPAACRATFTCAAAWPDCTRRSRRRRRRACRSTSFTSTRLADTELEGFLARSRRLVTRGRM